VTTGNPAYIISGALLANPARPDLTGPSRIGVADGRIVSIDPVGPGEMSPAETQRLLMPALANAHDHGRGLLPLSYGTDDARLEEWIHSLARQPKVDAYRMAAAAFGRMAASGIGAVNHCHVTQDPGALLEEAEAVSRAARDVGIHVAFAMPFGGRNPGAYGDLDRLLMRLPAADRAAVVARTQTSRTLAQSMELMQRIEAFEHETFHVQYGPIAPQWATEEALLAIADRSEQTGRRIHMHLLETKRQREWADAAYPDGGIVAYLASIGFLSPRLTVAHAVWLTPGECELLAEHGVSASINLSSNFRLQSGHPPVGAMRAAGMRFAIGLDGMSFDDDDDMLREARLLMRLHAGTGAHAPLPRGELLDALCNTGRRSIVPDDHGGRIEIGAPADLVALDLGHITRDRIGEADLLGLVLARATKRDVDALWVNGRAVVSGGQVVSIDHPAVERELIAEARAAGSVDPESSLAIDRLTAALTDYYACGEHCTHEQ
jgi:5-methylthioadenosine/S-adenosylhomocysteine deaminase